MGDTPHGGARPGSGRPRQSLKKTKIRKTYDDPEFLAAVERLEADFRAAKSGDPNPDAVWDFGHIARRAR